MSNLQRRELHEPHVACRHLYLLITFPRRVIDQAINLNGLVGITCRVTCAVANCFFFSFHKSFVPLFQLATPPGISTQPRPEGLACKPCFLAFIDSYTWVSESFMEHSKYGDTRIVCIDGPTLKDTAIHIRRTHGRWFPYVDVSHVSFRKSETRNNELDSSILRCL